MKENPPPDLKVVWTRGLSCKEDGFGETQQDSKTHFPTFVVIERDAP